MFVPIEAPFPEDSARAAVARAVCWSDALRALGYEPKGHNIRTLQRWARRWKIDASHLDKNIGRKRASASRQLRLEAVLVRDSKYPRSLLKPRLLRAGIKQPVCEMCGQGELWRGRRMSMILDHINGVSNDNRLENLRMVCPNCAATLGTHCGRNLPRSRACPSCGTEFAPRHIRHRYCSMKCWGAEAAELRRGTTHPETRKVSRPSYEQLVADLQTMSYLAVGRKYGVSDNAIRKWLKWYERQREREPRQRAA
jgi:transposase